MTIYIDSVKRIRGIKEPNGAFEVDLSAGSIGSFKDIPAIEGTIKLQLLQPTETPGHVEQRLDGYPLKMLMPKTAKLSFDIGIETLDTKAIASTTAAQGALGMLLEIGMGGQTLGTGTTIASTSTTTSLVCTSAAGIAPGTAVALATGAGGAMEIREVKSKSSNTLTLKHALSSIPANGSAVVSCASYWLGGTDGSQTTSLQLVVEGLSPMDRWIIRGGQLESLGLDGLSPAGIARMKMSWAFTKWDYADGTDDAGGTIADFDSSALGLASYVNVRPQVIFNSEFRAFTVGTTSISNTLLHAPKVEFKPAIKYTAHRTPSTASTYKQWIRDRSVPVITGGFTVPEEDKTWYNALAARTSKAFALQCGSDIAAGGFLLVAPTCQVSDVQQSSADNIHAVDVQWTARLDEDTPQSSDLELSTFRLHLV